MWSKIKQQRLLSWLIGKWRDSQDVEGLEGAGCARGILARSCSSQAGEAQNSRAGAGRRVGKKTGATGESQDKQKGRIWMWIVQNLQVTELTLSHTVHDWKYKSQCSSKKDTPAKWAPEEPSRTSLLPSQPAAEGPELRLGIGALKVSLDTSQVCLSSFRMCTKCTQLHNLPEKKRQVLQGAFQNMTLSSCVCVELIPSLVLGKLSCWKDNLSYKKYNQNLDHLFFSNYIMVL